VVSTLPATAIDRGISYYRRQPYPARKSQKITQVQKPRPIDVQARNA